MITKVYVMTVGGVIGGAYTNIKKVYENVPFDKAAYEVSYDTICKDIRYTGKWWIPIKTGEDKQLTNVVVKQIILNDEVSKFIL